VVPPCPFWDPELGVKVAILFDDLFRDVVFLRDFLGFLFKSVVDSFEEQHAENIVLVV
jgi:hypothetical protein